MKYLPLIHRPFKKVLVANRGEIAVRIIRACRDLELSPIAVYSEADTQSKHVSLADQAYCIGPAISAQSYLSVENIIAAARQSGAEAVHPGFGFLSENAAFANAVLAANLVWIGPSPDAMHAMGDKTFSRTTVTAAGVPCSPGVNHPLADLKELQLAATQIGFPLILKAAAGGGGRGMRVVRTHAELPDALQACQREALAYFGNPDVFCERYIERPRHVEFQILADSQGHTIHLGERDCTVQRRHQKLIEEAPSSYISAETRFKMGAVAIKAAQAVGYVNAGTVEFILESPTRFYFMEMNTRIQVEHPVTECITGIDLVQSQLKIAMGQPLGMVQSDVTFRGWAMEARVNAENAFAGFRPDPGEITHVELPAGPGVRVDSHIYAGYKVPEFYDSMIAKIIVHGVDRKDAVAKMKRALGETIIEGIETSIPYHQALLSNDQFLQGDYCTRFVEENENLLTQHQEALPALNQDQASAIGLVMDNAAHTTQPTQQGDFAENWSRAAKQESTRRSL